jgi:hypothetical protein
MHTTVKYGTEGGGGGGNRGDEKRRRGGKREARSGRSIVNRL